MPRGCRDGPGTYSRTSHNRLAVSVSDRGAVLVCLPEGAFLGRQGRKSCRRSGFRREILFPESGWEGARILGIITLILIKKPGRADMPFPAKTTPTGVEPVSRA